MIYHRASTTWEYGCKNWIGLPASTNGWLETSSRATRHAIGTDAISASRGKEHRGNVTGLAIMFIPRRGIDALPAYGIRVHVCTSSRDNRWRLWMRYDGVSQCEGWSWWHHRRWYDTFHRRHLKRRMLIEPCQFTDWILYRWNRSRLNVIWDKHQCCFGIILKLTVIHF